MPELISVTWRCSGGGVGFLDDAGHAAGLVAQDPAVALRVGRLRSQDCYRGTRCLVLGDQAGQRLGAQQRRVGEQHDHGAVDDAERLDHRAYRVSGAPGSPALLHDEGRLRGRIARVGGDLARRGR